MRLPSVLLLLLVGCGGSAVASVPDQEPVPATPLPDEQAVAPTDGPTGWVTMFSMDDNFVATARFMENATRFSSSTGVAGCYVGGATGRPVPGVNAGTVSIAVPTRDGERTVDLLFDAKSGYGLGHMDSRAEPGMVLRIRADGDRVPAFDIDHRSAANIVFDVPDVIELDANNPRELALSWTADGANDEVFVDLELGEKSVGCFFASTTGKGGGTIPSELVAKVVTEGPAECTTTTCRLFISSKRSRSIAVGDWTMVVSHGIATRKEVRVTR